MARKKKTKSDADGYQGLGGSSFTADVDSGLGKQAQAPGLDSVKLPPGGFSNVGGSSFGDDVDEGLGNKNSNNSAFGGLGGNSFAADADKGLGAQAPGKMYQQEPEQEPAPVPEAKSKKKKAKPKNMIDEWSELAGGGW